MQKNSKVFLFSVSVLVGLVAGTGLHALASPLTLAYQISHNGKPLPMITILAIAAAEYFYWWYIPLVALITLWILRMKREDGYGSLLLLLNAAMWLAVWFYFIAVLAPFASFSNFP